MPPVHLAEQRGQDAAAGGADRMAERDARAVDVEALDVVVDAPPPGCTASTWAAKASLSSIRSMSPTVRPGPAQRLGRWRAPARCPSGCGGTPATAQDPSRASGRSPRSAAIVRVGDDADRRTVVLAAGVAGGDRRPPGPAAHHRAAGRPAPRAGVGARDARRCPRPARLAWSAMRDRDDLVVEDAGPLGRHRPLVRPQGEARPARCGRCRTRGAGSRPSRSCRPARG